MSQSNADTLAPDILRPPHKTAADCTLYFQIRESFPRYGTSVVCGRCNYLGEEIPVDEPIQPPRTDEEALIRRLVKAANITEDQARELVTALGYDWSSLIREARLLTRKSS